MCSLLFHGVDARSMVAATAVTMSSAAARGPAGRVYFAAKVSNKPAGAGSSAAATSACLQLVASRRRSTGCAGLRAEASSSSSHMGVEKVNGRKVNGSANRKVSLQLEKITARVDEAAVGAGGGAAGRDVPSHAFNMGRFVENRFVYRQTFVIRSYEIGPDKTATMETLMNLLQETALNHVMCSGLAGDGFGATHEMSLRKLIWVVTRINIQVDKYSRWGDVVEIDTWVAAAGKNGMRRDWVIRDITTHEIITRATSTWVIMNRETRRLSKIPEPVRAELNPYYLDRMIIHEGEGDASKIDKLDDGTAQSIRSGLEPRWSDMDANQHVNNVKYIGWIMESVPMNVLEDYSLTSMTLEYRRECRQSHLLESLTSLGTKLLENSHGDVAAPRAGVDLGSIHLLRLQEDKAEVVRARAAWRRKGYK